MDNRELEPAAFLNHYTTVEPAPSIEPDEKANRSEMLFTAEQIHDLMERVHWDGEAENPWMKDTDPEKSSAWLDGWSAADSYGP